MFIGIAPLTMVRTRAGRSEYVYLGAPAPADIHPEDAERLVDEGFLAEVDDVVPAEVVVPDDPATGTAGEGVTLERPKRMATKPAWVDYRVRQNLLTEDLAGEVTVTKLQDDAFMATFLEQARARAEAQAEAEREAEEDARLQAEDEARLQAEEEARPAVEAGQTGSTS